MKYQLLVNKFCSNSNRKFFQFLPVWDPPGDLQYLDLVCGKDAVSPLRLKTYRQGSYRAALAKCSTCDCNAGKDQITTRIQRYPGDARGQTGGTVWISRWALVHLWMVCNLWKC